MDVIPNLPASLQPPVTPSQPSPSNILLPAPPASASSAASPQPYPTKNLSIQAPDEKQVTSKRERDSSVAAEEKAGNAGSNGESKGHEEGRVTKKAKVTAEDPLKSVVEAAIAEFREMPIHGSSPEYQNKITKLQKYFTQLTKFGVESAAEVQKLKDEFKVQQEAQKKKEQAEKDKQVLDLLKVMKSTIDKHPDAQRLAPDADMKELQDKFHELTSDEKLSRLTQVTKGVFSLWPMQQVNAVQSPMPYHPAAASASASAAPFVQSAPSVAESSYMQAFKEFEQQNKKLLGGVYSPPSYSAASIPSNQGSNLLVPAEPSYLDEMARLMEGTKNIRSDWPDFKTLYQMTKQAQLVS
jgi:hypothetical protein